LEFLLGLIRQEFPDAEAAVVAFMGSLPNSEWTMRLETVVSSNPRLRHVFKESCKS
jgi:hypothetical protein